MNAVIARLPLWARKLIVDAIEGSVAFALALNLVIPGSLAEAQAQAGVVGVGILTAVIAAARRNAPGFFGWVRELFGVTGE